MQPPHSKETIALITTGPLGRISLKIIVRAEPEKKPQSQIKAHTKAYWPAGHNTVCYGSDHRAEPFLWVNLLSRHKI